MAVAVVGCGSNSNVTSDIQTPPCKPQGSVLCLDLTIHFEQFGGISGQSVNKISRIAVRRQNFVFYVYFYGNLDTDWRFDSVNRAN